VLGRDVSAEMVGSLLDAVRPDYVQYDAKGHPGWLGWPSQVGPSAPGIVNDSLAIWRRATAARGVSLYIHFSGVWDFEACKRHPEWARVGPDGKRDTRQTSTFGPYVDELMLPQLREAASKYDLDGVWVDGECWATNPDYSPAVEAAFRAATGLVRLPQGPRDPGWLQFLELNREQFRRYVRHYTDELHRTHPRFQVASNWLYSTFVPEQPTLPVDFLSSPNLEKLGVEQTSIAGSPQTAFPLTLELLVNRKVISLARAIELLTTGPAKAFHLDRQGLGSLPVGAPADFTLVDLDARITVDRAFVQSRSFNTPFKGWTLPGQVLGTWVGGKRGWG